MKPVSCLSCLATHVFGWKLHIHDSSKLDSKSIVSVRLSAQTETDRQAGRQAGRPAGRRTDGQTDRQTDRHAACVHSLMAACRVSYAVAVLVRE